VEGRRVPYRMREGLQFFVQIVEGGSTANESEEGYIQQERGSTVLCMML
jgi:hypothetical protein